MDLLNQKNLLDKAYKKLKSSVYYDKTNLILRDKIVRFESSQNEELNKYFETLWDDFLSDNQNWKDLRNKILSQIDVVLLPKKIKDTSEKDHKESQVVTNFVADNTIEVEEIQYFIDMPIEGHVLGVLWVFLVGWKLDKELQNCYGNRIRKKLYTNSSFSATYSPYLFEPYFEKYESWRDMALEKAQNYLKQGDDILIMSLDFKRFFYSVDITMKFMDSLLDVGEQSTGFNLDIEKRINDFVADVIFAYHKKISHFDDKVGKVLPIGFIPSNILANYCLKNFDDAIAVGWSPLYYGRYVDDILIVDRVEKNSPISQQIHGGTLTIDSAISHYLVQSSRWPYYTKRGKAILKNKKETYTVLPEYTQPLGEMTKLEIQQQKAKVFYFDKDNTDALITCFREKIGKSRSEFRQMPEDDAVFQRDDYQSIFELEQSGLNKFRDVKGVALDKFQLSKYLGKYQRISGLVNDSKKARFIQDISKIFTPESIIKNYILWEKVFTVLVTNEAFTDLRKFVDLIRKAISNVDFKGDITVPQEPSLYTQYLHNALERFLISGLSRAISLYWTNENWTSENSRLMEELGLSTNEKDLPRQYNDTRMSDKSMYVIWPDLLLTILQRDQRNTSFSLNCTLPKKVYEYLSVFKNQDAFNVLDKIQYSYYPYMVTLYDLSLAYQIAKVCSENNKREVNDINWLNNKYNDLNYKTRDGLPSLAISLHKFPETESTNGEVDSCKSDQLENQKHKVFCVGKKVLSKVRVAISSIKMEDSNFQLLVQGNPNRSYERYQRISKLVNEAIVQKANVLVMPEACVPYEWLSTLARTSAKNQMAIITGVEHLIESGNVYNMTAVILPFESEEYRCAQIFFHHKNHFAPDERRQVIGYRLNPIEGDGYELYRWNDFYFSVYCCYELASIRDRAIFQSYADAIIAVEWNHDVNYYSNIIESLSRDIHCYCIQVNSADYGDSRVTIPTKTEKKDILRTKGGEYPTVLATTIDVQKLREFQLKEFELQKEDKSFKPTPPEFRVDITERKIKHTLFN